MDITGKPLLTFDDAAVAALREARPRPAQMTRAEFVRLLLREPNVELVVFDAGDRPGLT